jgi:hypothetical protein
MQFATNHLGHFALALGLHDALAAAGAARIVSLSSVGHRRSPVIFDDLNFTPVLTTWGWPTDSPRPPTSYSPSRRHAAGVATASPPTRSTRERSRPPTCCETWTLQDDRARRGDKRPRRHLTTARRHRRPLLRGLQRSAGSRPRRPRPWEADHTTSSDRRLVAAPGEPASRGGVEPSPSSVVHFRLSCAMNARPAGPGGASLRKTTFIGRFMSRGVPSTRICATEKGRKLVIVSAS